MISSVGSSSSHYASISSASGGSLAVSQDVAALTGRIGGSQIHDAIKNHLAVASGLPAYHSGFNSTALDSSEASSAFISGMIQSVNSATGASDSSNRSFQDSFMNSLNGIDAAGGNTSGATVDLVERAKALLHAHSLPNQIDDVRSLLLGISQALSTQTDMNAGQLINTTA
jgi:hypothetical protein